MYKSRSDGDNDEETSTGNNVEFTGLKYFLNMGFIKCWTVLWHHSFP